MTKRRPKQYWIIPGSSFRHNTPQRDINLFVQVSVIHFGMTVAQATKKCRKKEFVKVRYLIMYVGYLVYGYTYEALAFALKRKDHTSTIHAIKTVNDLKDTDPAYAADVLEYKKYMAEKF